MSSQIDKKENNQFLIWLNEKWQTHRGKGYKRETALTFKCEVEVSQLKVWG